MDSLESSSNVIVKQELIIDDLKQNEYEHLLQEFYYNQPDQTSLVPAPLECKSFNFLLETFDEEVAHPGYAEDGLKTDLPSSVIVKEEFVFEGHGETSLVDVLYSTVETKAVESVKCSGTKKKGSPIKRPEYAQRCPVCKVWYHTVAGLENHVQRHHGRQLTEGKQRTETHPGHVEDDLMEDLPSSVTVKEELVFEGLDETSLGGTGEAKAVEAVKTCGSKRKGPPIKRPEYAQKCPVCKIWYHTVAGLENHLQRHHGRQLTEGKQRIEIHPGHVEDDLIEEPADETSLVDILYSTAESKVVEMVKSFGAKQNVTQIKRPECAQKCPVCKVWYHTVAGLENHLQRRHGRELTDGKQRAETQVCDEAAREDKSQRKTKKVWHCARCDKTFTSNQKYKLHKYRHTNIDSGRFKCNFCSKSLGSKQEQDNHEKRKHQTNPFKKNRINLLHQAQPSTIVLGDILRQRKDVKKIPKKTLRKQPSPSLRQKQGRPKGCRQCPLCKQWFLTQDELRVHFAIHNESIKTRREEVFKSEPILNERRKVGRPKKLRNSENLPKVKPESEEVQFQRRKVGRPKGSRNGQLLKGIKEESSQHVRRKVGRPKKSVDSLKLNGAKQRFLRQVRRKVGRPKGSKNSPKVLQPDSVQLPKMTKPFTFCARCDKKFPTYARFKLHKMRHRNVDLGLFTCAQCAKKFASKREQVLHEQNGHKLKSRPESTPKQSPSELAEEVPIRRKVGRPKKSGNCSKSNGNKQGLFRQIRLKIGKPKRSKLHGVPYCARCDKEFSSDACFTAHTMRHRNVDLALFSCKPCAKTFGSKWEQVIHERNGHNLKAGRPKADRLLSESKPASVELVDEAPIRRKVGRPRKTPQTTSFDQNERKRKMGRTQGCRKCPLCKVWFQSADMFKDHLRNHIQG